MATQQQVAHYQGLASQAQNWRAVAADIRREQIEANRQQAARIAGLTWGDVACAIRVLGMPEASEDMGAVLKAMHRVVESAGFENAEECLQHLGWARECVEELRMPVLSEREQAEADAMDRAERRFEEARDGL